ncbi:MAG: class I SAM-dependent methyltransferase [Snowella sp.]|nr:class I SAM-dependent methyltransferase [Snowella sp.]
MSNYNESEYLNRSLEQFEKTPFPNIPIESLPSYDLQKLYDASLVTSYYRRNRKVVSDLSHKAILDVACGTGVTTLITALANPSAKIIGTDISPKSVAIAEARLNYHGIKNFEFHVLSLEEISQLDYKFDLINASDVLYLLPDLGIALQILRNVLSEDGVIRGNVHSYYNRLPIFRAQNLFEKIGLLNDNPGEVELNIVRDFFDSLHDEIILKKQAWANNFNKQDDQRLLSNHLLLNDKGFTMPQLLDALKFAELELFSMVDWRNWDWWQLFKNVDNLPSSLAKLVATDNLEDQLILYELVQPNKRLLDFWCGHPHINQQAQKITWQLSDPAHVNVYLHPCLKIDAFKHAVLESNNIAPLNLGEFFDPIVKEVWIDRTILQIIFIPLLEQSCSLEYLIERYLQICKIHSITLQEIPLDKARELVTQSVNDQEKLGILMIDW